MHPAALLVPEPTPEEFAELKADIKKNGLRERIVFLGEKLLDGRSRHRALTELRTEGALIDGRTISDDIRTYYSRPAGTREAADPVAFVVSKNIRRRHLTPGQRAQVVLAATEMVEALRKQAADREKAGTLATPDARGKTSEKLAKVAGVSSRTVERAKAKGKGDATVRSGKYQHKGKFAPRISELPKREDTGPVGDFERAKVNDAIAALRALLKDLNAVRGVFWAASHIRAAIAELSKWTGQEPNGFTVRRYAKRHGITITDARARIKKMEDSGIVEVVGHTTENGRNVSVYNLRLGKASAGAAKVAAPGIEKK